MNRFLTGAAMVICLGLLAAGCGREKAPIRYSNLNDSSVRVDLNRLLHSAGIPSQNRAQLFDQADLFNACMEPEQLTQGFIPLGEPLYDPYALQEVWEAEHPDFPGYNCRITAFGLLEDSVLKIPAELPVPDTPLLGLDLLALEENGAIDIRVDDFRNFYAQVPTEMTRDIRIHARNFLNSWKEKGITFRDNPAVRMINVVFHMEEDGENTLYVGHAGVLLPTPDGNLWFLEKLAFQEPFQVVELRNRRELQEYLMEKYDTDQNQPTAKPFILENDQLMDTGL